MRSIITSTITTITGNSRMAREKSGSWGKTIGPEAYNSPGPKPGSTRAIPQRKAISEGYASPKTDRCVHTFQSQGETGEVHAPNLSRWKGK
jgi:hypothetical protein